jgi:hypothetical protein
VGSLHSEKSFVVWKTESHEETALPSIEKMKHSRIKLALSGEALSVLLADNVSETRKLMDLIRVYGRCTPYDKVVVVSEFVKVRLLVVGRRRFHKQKVHDPSPVSVPPPAVARIHYAYDR